jgi:hypothetical protein
MGHDFHGPHRIPAAHVQARLGYVIAECTVAMDRARELMDEARVVAIADEPALWERVGLVERVLLGDRLDELRQWDRYVRPRSRVGRAAHRLGLWLVRLGHAIG